MKSLSTGKRKIIFDVLLNIVATAIPTFVLQFLILPTLAGHMSDMRYGLLVTILALLNVVPATLGNTLNNIRLIIGNEKEKVEDTRDYNVLLLFMAGINLITVALFSYFYERDITLISLFLTLLVSVLWLLREYHIVAFRIQLNYIYITVSNVIMVAGYGVGFVLYRILGHWQLIYVFGHLFSLIFIFSKSSLWKEPYKRSEQFIYIGWQTVLLFVSGLLTRITTYADKLLIFPILGGATVSVYYAATLFGKVVSLMITPISSVMLSYLSKSKRKNDDTFKLALLSSAIVCTICYFFCIAISKPVLGFLYPQFVDEAMQYIWLTTGTMVLSALISIVNPFVLKFFDMKWQIAINVVYVALYVGVSMSLLGVFGLFGFCIGTVISTALKLLFMLYIYNQCKEKTLN